MTRKLLLSTVASIALSGTAFAADLPSRTHMAMAPVAAPPVFTWTGFYVGGSAGMIRATNKVDDLGGAITGQTITSSGDGGIFGLDAGYNWQSGAFVFGVETDIALSTAKSNTAAPNFRFFLPGGGTTSSRIDSLGTVRGRLGYAVDRALFYVTGGLAYGSVKDRAVGDGDPGSFVSANSWRTGWTLGAGIEYAVTPHWTVRAEGLYVDLGKKANVGRIPGLCNFSFKDTEVIARIGVNYKF